MRSRSGLFAGCNRPGNICGIIWRVPALSSVGGERSSPGETGPRSPDLRARQAVPAVRLHPVHSQLSRIHDTIEALMQTTSRRLFAAAAFLALGACVDTGPLPPPPIPEAPAPMMPYAGPTAQVTPGPGPVRRYRHRRYVRRHRRYRPQCQCTPATAMPVATPYATPGYPAGSPPMSPGMPSYPSYPPAGTAPPPGSAPPPR